MGDSGNHTGPSESLRPRMCSVIDTRTQKSTSTNSISFLRYEMKRNSLRGAIKMKDWRGSPRAVGWVGEGFGGVGSEVGCRGGFSQTDGRGGD